MALRRDQKTLLFAAVASFALWAVPLLRPFALPLVYLNTHIHELCHALMAHATGGAASHIMVFANGSGVTPVSGGSIFLSASAGYVGTAIVGALLLASSRTLKGARSMLWTTFAFLAVSLLLFVRGDTIGILSALLWLGALPLMAYRLKGEWVLFAGQFLGLQMALTSLQSLLVLLKVTVSPEPRSDALILQQVTGVPAIVWAVGWSAFGLAAIVVALVTAWKPATQSRA